MLITYIKKKKIEMCEIDYFTFVYLVKRKRNKNKNRKT